MVPVPKRRRMVKPAAERREEILSAALRLFNDKGFDATTVQDIAKVADVASGTVYLYFSSKGDILGGLHEAFHEGMHARLQEVSARLLTGLQDGTVTYDQAIDEWIDAIADYVLAHRAETTVFCRYMPEVREPLVEERKFNAFVAGVLTAAVETGHVHISDPEMAAHLLVPMLRDAFTSAIVYGEPPDLSRLVVQAKELFRKALAVER